MIWIIPHFMHSNSKDPNSNRPQRMIKQQLKHFEEIMNGLSEETATTSKKMCQLNDI